MGHTPPPHTHAGVSAHLVVLVIDAEALAEVAEDLGTVLLELEVAGQVLPRDFGGGGGVSGNMRYAPPVSVSFPTPPPPAHRLKRWLLTLILELALKSSGSSMTGSGTWLSSLICGGEGGGVGLGPPHPESPTG